jgi:hypothetical protein
MKGEQKVTKEVKAERVVARRVFQTLEDFGQSLPPAAAKSNAWKIRNEEFQALENPV